MENRQNTTVLAVLLEDGVALFGILLTLLVAGVGYVAGPHPEFDAIVAIVVGATLGVMAVFLAAINRRVLIDTSDATLDRAAEAWLGARGVAADVRSLVLDNDRAIVFVRARGDVSASDALGAELKVAMRAAPGKQVDQVYWRFARPQVSGAPAH